MRRKMIFACLAVMLCMTGCSTSAPEVVTDEISTDGTEVYIEETESIDGSDLDTKVLEEAVVVPDDVPEPLYTFEDDDKVMYSVTSLNIRNLPSEDGMKVGILSKNDKVQITGKCNETGWYRIVCDESIGYVSAKYIADEPVVEQVATKADIALPEAVDASVTSAPEPVVVSEAPVQTTFVQGESGVSQDMINGVESYYNKLPENVRNYFQSSGWRVTVSGTSLGPRWGYPYSILALTVYGNSQIWIDNRSSAKSSIVHEMGHFIDYKQGFTSSTQAFQDIYAAEVLAFRGYHATHINNTNTTLEYFAESFQQCVYDPSGMSAACPQTYNYIMSIVNSL